MNLPPLNLFNFLLAALPLIMVLYLMVRRNWGGSQAGLVGWATAVVVAVIFFGGHMTLLWVAFGRALLLAIFVLYIIWMALLFYFVVDDAGVIVTIGEELPKLVQDRPMQTLLLGWVFGSFLQGASGFGVPAAVIAPLLVGLGMGASTAVTVALLGHAWAVTFGSLGSSFVSLMAATNLPGEILAEPAALFLGICCFACGLGSLWATNGYAAIRQRWVHWLILGTVMSAVQWWLATHGLWNLAAFGAGLAGMMVALIDLRTHFSDRLLGKKITPVAGFNSRRLLFAFAPYLVLALVIITGQLVWADPLGIVELNYNFPSVTTQFGWHIPAGAGRSINLFGHAGALLLYASLIVFGWYRWQGTLVAPKVPYSGRHIAYKTVKRSVKSTISIVALLAMAVTMHHAGMTQLLAEAMSQYAGGIFPLLSPFIGALGAFMTGSNTNSNVVFGQLQQQTATALQLPVVWILAAQTAGGAMGSMFAPAKVVVGCSTVEGADEGQVLRQAMAYGGLVILLIGGLTWLMK